MIPLNLFFLLCPTTLASSFFFFFPFLLHRPALRREKGPVQKVWGGLVAFCGYAFKRNQILEVSGVRLSEAKVYPSVRPGRQMRCCAGNAGSSGLSLAYIGSP